MKLSFKIEALAKLIDALYKKLVILVAIAGGFGAYAVKFLQNANSIGYLFILIFTIVSIAVFYSYVKLNDYIREIERDYHEHL